MTTEILIKIANARSQLVAPQYVIDAVRENALAYTTESTMWAASNSAWDGKVRLMSTKGLYPTGLTHLLVSFLKNKGWEYKAKDYRTRPTPLASFPALNLGDKIPFPHQEIAARVSDEKTRGVFLAATGYGKSILSAMITDRKKVDTLVVVPNLTLKSQLTTDYREWFGHANIGEDLHSNAPIVICNFQKLIRFEKDAKVWERFKMLMIDEFHHASSDSYLKINKLCANAFFRYGMTGTYLRTDGSDMEMHGVLSNVIYKKTSSELIEEGYLTRPEITITPLKIFEQLKMKISFRARYEQAYADLIRSPHFSNIIADRANMHIKNNRQTIVLVRRIEHGKMVKALIPDAIFLSGTDKSSWRDRVKSDFNAKKIPCIVASEIFGEGVDIPTIDALINARAQKTEIQTVQGVGRALRKAPGKELAYIDDFLFMGQQHLENHSLERINSYKKEPAFIIKGI